MSMVGEDSEKVGSAMSQVRMGGGTPRCIYFFLISLSFMVSPLTKAPWKDQPCSSCFGGSPCRCSSYWELRSFISMK